MTIFAHNLSFDEVKELLNKYSSDGRKIKKAEATKRDLDGTFDLLIVFESEKFFHPSPGGI